MPDEQRAVFTAKDGQVVNLADIGAVSIGSRGNDIINTWIEVRHGTTPDPGVAYLNDGGWLGWRPLLTRSNLQIVASLHQLVPAEPA